jgi:hypothetical protein
MTRGPLWLAGEDSIAHLRNPGTHLAYCGLRAIEERYAWPTVTRCARCLAALTPPTPGIPPGGISDRNPHCRFVNRAVVPVQAVRGQRDGR